MNCLVHTRYAVLREGFEALVATALPQLACRYVDLTQGGTLAADDFVPKMVVLLKYHADEDFNLCQKIRLFLPHTPLVVIQPQAPATYVDYLLGMGVSRVLSLQGDTSRITAQLTEAICSLIQPSAVSRPPVPNPHKTAPVPLKR